MTLPPFAADAAPASTEAQESGTHERSSRFGMPTATYRLQMRAEFGFAEAANVVPYLKRLGISHLYLSPIFAAAPGSTHGYDIIDHDRVNPELGGLPGLYNLHQVLAEHNMGLVLDIVPNHVGVAGGNPWWRDVLRFGQQSEFAAFFDIDWQGQPELPNGVLIYPCLGRPFGRSLEAGEFSLAYDGTEIVVR